MRRRAALALIVAALALAFAPPAAPRAAEPATALVMFELEGCPYCRRFMAEIGPIYAKTDEGKRAPLRRVDMSRPRPPDLAFIEFVVYSPTFVLVHEGREIGRIVGYTGDEAFWSQLTPLVAKLPPPRGAATRRATDAAPASYLR